ncbi:NADPH-dependent ferric siderophore reductase [Brevibacterium sanguinis]|uniref:NADPH-dependent ferric siderophore reductase n=2 Tax=Brevibacterium TaxID=1696 RepID=A0A366IKQ9_9MICO|nr:MULTISPECIES: siderophore-interacting protein [Brevibacterium]RBP65075.1 NADPH-dependent ferric siderophore reductase [Brevibacterium sanguinis]RBP71338.1 NADPH-dependent ferric siderophore reductase [Brevibacterium celere]
MPRTSRPLQVLPIVLREVEVIDVRDITPNMRRLTVGGEQLAAGEMNGMHRPAFRSEGFDDHVKLVIPPPGVDEIDTGVQDEFRFNWNREALSLTRDYTVRSVDPEAGSFAFDVVRHDSGHAADWAFRARPGDRLHIAGPKTCAGLSEGVDFHLLVADETALPAVGRWLEEAPAGTRGHIIVEVPTAADIQDIPTAADVEIDWLIRDGFAPGDSPLLFDAVRNVQLPPGRTFAWCAGEAMTIAPIRRHLRRDLGLPKEDIEVVGYWRRTAAPAPDSASHPTDIAEAAAPSAVLDEVHEMTELLPPIITRVAVTLGIGDLVAGGTSTAEAIAAETSTPIEGIRVVLTAMCALGLLERDGAEYRNTATGAVLTGEGVAEQLSLADPANADLFSIVDLLDVIRGGWTARVSRASALTAESWTQLRARDEALDTAHRGRTLDHVQYVLDPLLDLEAIASARSIALAGDAGAEVAAELTRKAPASGRTIHTPAATARPGGNPGPRSIARSCSPGSPDAPGPRGEACSPTSSPAAPASSSSSPSSTVRNPMTTGPRSSSRCSRPPVTRRTRATRSRTPCANSARRTWPSSRSAGASAASRRPSSRRRADEARRRAARQHREHGHDHEQERR